MAVGINIRAAQRAGDHRTVTVGRDGTGDFPNLKDALDYVGRFSNDAINFAVIKLGPGTHSFDNSAGVTVLPNFIEIIGDGSLVSKISATTVGQPLFSCQNLVLQELSILNCSVAINKTTSPTATLSIFKCIFNGIATAVQCLDGFTFVANTTIQSITATGTGVLINGGTIAAVINCQFVTPVAGAIMIQVNAGNVSIRSNAFDATLIANTIGLDVNDGVRVESANNVFTEVATAITIANDATLNFSSKSDRILSATTASVIIEGAAGINAATYRFDDLTADPDFFTLNGNTPPQDFVDDEGSFFTKIKITTITGNTTLSHIHKVVHCNSASDFTVTLPPAAKFNGWEYTIKNINTGIVTVDGDGSETIDGATTQDIAVQWDSMTIYSNGTGWFSR